MMIVMNYCKVYIIILKKNLWACLGAASGCLPCGLSKQPNRACPHTSRGLCQPADGQHWKGTCLQWSKATHAAPVGLQPSSSVCKQAMQCGAGTGHADTYCCTGLEQSISGRSHPASSPGHLITPRRNVLMYFFKKKYCVVLLFVAGGWQDYALGATYQSWCSLNHCIHRYPSPSPNKMTNVAKYIPQLKRSRAKAFLFWRKVWRPAFRTATLQIEPGMLWNYIGAPVHKDPCCRRKWLLWRVKPMTLYPVEFSPQSPVFPESKYPGISQPRADNSN